MTHQDLFHLILAEAAKAGVREMQAVTEMGALDVFIDGTASHRLRLYNRLRPHVATRLHLTVTCITQAPAIIPSPPIVAKPARKECEFAQWGWCHTHDCDANADVTATRWVCGFAEPEEYQRAEDAAAVAAEAFGCKIAEAPEPIHSRNHGTNPTNINVIPAKDAQGVHVIRSAEEYERLFGRRPDPDMFKPRVTVLPLQSILVTSVHSEQLMHDALTRGWRIHGDECRCQLCLALDAGKWETNEAWRWLKRVSGAHYGIGYALRTFICGGMTERDHG